MISLTLGLIDLVLYGCFGILGCLDGVSYLLVFAEFVSFRWLCVLIVLGLLVTSRKCLVVMVGCLVIALL